MPEGLPRPTRARYWVVVFAVTLAIIQYIDTGVSVYADNCRNLLVAFPG